MRALAWLVAAAASAAGMVAAYVALGGGDYQPAAAVDPCRSQPWGQTAGVAGLQNRVALSALAGAACRLHTTREELALAFTSPDRLRRFQRQHGIGDRSLTDAARAGLLRAIDEGQRGGQLNAIEAFLLRQAAERVPRDRLMALVRGALSP